MMLVSAALYRSSSLDHISKPCRQSLGSNWMNFTQYVYWFYRPRLDLMLFALLLACGLMYAQGDQHYHLIFSKLDMYQWIQIR